MAKLGCAKCGGSMANGGTTPKKILAKAPVNMYGIPQENMGTSSQYGFGRKGGSVKKYEPGGSISSDRVGKNRIVHKNKMYGTDNSGNDWVAKRKIVYDNMGTKDNPIVSNQRSRSKITRTDAVTGDQKTTVTKINSNGKMTKRNALFAVK